MRKYPTNKIVWSHIDEIWSIVLADFFDNKTSNHKGFRYIFNIFDIFFKKTWCTPLKNKNIQTITNEFWSILTKSKRSPLKLESDRGSEWDFSVFQKFFKAKNIHHYSRFTDKGPSVAQKIIRTLRNLLKKPKFGKRSADWLSELPSVLKRYNNTNHNSIKITPIQASKKLMKK